MQIDWTVISCLVIGFFAWSGFARGWWKEAITAVFLAALIFLLQRPDWAASLIEALNNLLETVWNLLPDSVITFISDSLETFFGIDTGGGPFQLNASSSSTWIVILILVVALATLLGRLSFANRPTLVGSILGTTLGAFNGFLILNLTREYLDGRALPGRAVSTPQLAVAGGPSFATAAQTVTIQATNLPDFSILDSVVPWVLIGVAVLLAVAVLRTRIALKRNQAGGSKVDVRVLPPFYQPTKVKKQRTIMDELAEALGAR